jgi:chorismate-pyruvate lyase
MPNVDPSQAVMLTPQKLVELFYDDPTECGEFVKTQAVDMPAAYQSLLDHTDHMTVTVEAFYDSLVDVEVLDAHQDADYYARKILLKRRSDGQVVQFGIVRLTLGLLDDEVRRAVEARRMPLGRVMIKFHVMRRVELASLWQITPGTELRRYFASPASTYGRTAWIHVNGQAAVELLEIVAPVDTTGETDFTV